MFEGFFKSKFQKQCKSALNRILVRIEAIKRKRNAMQKYLKNDIADLLKNGFDLDAYSRAKGLLIEINTSACYDLVEQYCKVISDHLVTMNKQKECPEECKEAVPCLMFAAARFADLPELRELRKLFIDKYGKCLESYINQEFVEKLKTSYPTKDERIQLLYDVALEFDIEWDPKALEKQLFKPPPPNEQARVLPENTDDNEIIIKRTEIKPIRERDKHNLDNYKSQIIQEKPEKDRKKPVSYSLIPPPYTKPKPRDSETSSGSDSQDDLIPESVRKRNLKLPPGLINVPEDERIKKKDGSHSRMASFPGENKKSHGRAFSSTDNDHDHDHRKLLDYDDFVARLAALKRN